MIIQLTESQCCRIHKDVLCGDELIHEGKQMTA